MSISSLSEHSNRDERRRRSGDSRNRALHELGQKQQRTWIYSTEGRHLVVPLERVWLVRQTALRLRAEGAVTSIAAIARILGMSAHALEVNIAYWRRIYRDHIWLDGWLLRCEQTPS